MKFLYVNVCVICLFAAVSFHNKNCYYLECHRNGHVTNIEKITHVNVITHILQEKSKYGCIDLE